MKESRENTAYIEADAAATAMALTHTEAHESVDYPNEEAGGTGVMSDKNCAREWRTMLQKSVLEHGVGQWAAKVRGFGRKAFRYGKASQG